MAALTSTPFFWFGYLFVVLFVSADQKIIPAESGQNVTLPCRASNNNIIGVEWSRADLGDEYVLLYRGKQPVPDYQHSSFKNRVDLQDKQMKDGDVSLILNNVTINDARAYQCRVFMGDSRSWKSINNVTLSVDLPGQTGGDTEDGGKEDGSVGLIIVLSVSCVLAVVVVVVVFVCYRKCKKQNQGPY